MKPEKLYIGVFFFIAYYMIKSMLRMRKILWSKLRSSFGKEGRLGKEDVNSLMSKLNMNEEYKEAFRTKSYIEICNKVQGQMETRISLDEGQSLSFSSSTTALSPSSPRAEPVHLSEYLVEPCQETLISIERSKYDHSLANYFDISLEAGRICEFVLQNIHQVRVNYHTIRSVIKLIKRTPDSTSWSNNQYNSLYRNLASFALHSNPFSHMTPEKFHELHDGHAHLLHQLTSQCRNTKRRTKFIRCIKRALAIVGCGALAIALLVLAMHSMVGAVVAAPGVIICCLGLFVMKKLKQAKQESKKKQLERLEAQLDIAARGVYILINDFDTMSRLVQRLRDEMEHRKFAAEICVTKGKNGMLKEVAREFQMHESCFLEQLEELEKQIYLCFLDINRSRRLLLQEMDK